MNLRRAFIPDLTILQAFECAARHGSFTQAAAELNLTQSAVSRQIRMLEEQLGVTLFERIRKRVVLSAAGKDLLPEASRLLALSEDMVLRAKASADGKRTLSIAALPTFASRWLIPRLPDFMRRNPDTTIGLTSRSKPFDFAEEDFDLAIHYGQPVWARATCVYLCSEVILPVASPALLAQRPCSQPSDLERAPLLQQAMRPRLWAEWFGLHHADRTEAFVGSRFDQFNMIIEAAIAGIGFALLPRYLIEEELASGMLRIALDRPMSTENSYYVVLPDGKQDNPHAQAFQSWILSQVVA